MLLLASSCIISATSGAPAGDPGEWSLAEVGEWIADLDDVPSEHKRELRSTFERHGVNGAVLLYLDEESLREMEITSSLRRKLVLAAIDKLVASSVGGDGDFVLPREGSVERAAGVCSLNFYEFRQEHRQLFDQLTGLLSTCPRWAISLLPSLPEPARPAEPFRDDFPMNWIVWFFVPEYYLYSNSATIACGLPGLLAFVILANMVMRMVELIRALATRKGSSVTSTLLSLALGPLVVELKWGIGMWLYITFIWPIMPWFICDLIFQLNIWVFSGLHIYKIAKQWWKGKEETSVSSSGKTKGPGFRVYTTGFSF